MKHEIAHADVQPDEKFMQAIERYLGIAEKDVFRKSSHFADRNSGFKR